MAKKHPYNKPHISYDEQVDKLASRGMVIDDRDEAIRTLQHINYYRLGVYWHSYEVDHTSHYFAPNTRFSDIVALYDFDRKLRLLVLDAIERIEVSIRTQWTYHLSQAYGAHAHMIAKLHSKDWQKTVEDLHKEVRRSDEVFIRRIMQKYPESSPPIWAVSEIMSFGLLSKWYKNLRVNTARKKIASMYQVHPDILQSWMQHLTVIRNNCAHHSRLWNRHFDRAKPMHPQHHPVISSHDFVSGHQLFNTLTIILYLLDIISPGHAWRQRYSALVKEHPTVPLKEMGFPDDWPKRAIWQQSD
jgi:abortive infection bacteriophage resistance protein